MSNRKVEIKRLSLVGVQEEREGEVTTLDVELRYELGGVNPFTSNNEPRGYFLSVGPMTRDEARGMRRFMAWSGTKMLVEPANRFSQKKLEEVAAKVPEHPDYKRLIQLVAAKNKLTLAENLD